MAVHRSRERVRSAEPIRRDRRTVASAAPPKPNSPPQRLRPRHRRCRSPSRSQNHRGSTSRASGQRRDGLLHPSRDRRHRTARTPRRNDPPHALRSPRVSGDVLRRLLPAHHEHRSSPHAIPRDQEALFKADLFPLKSLDGDVGARQLNRHLDREVVTIPFGLSDDRYTRRHCALWIGRSLCGFQAPRKMTANLA